MDPQLTSLIVPPDEVAHIDECLARLVDDTGGNYALLLDKSGQVIASNGDGNRQDTTALGALIAGSFASSQQIAKLLREKDFREAVKQTDWNEYKDLNVFIHCTADAIVPTWAYMLIASQLEGIVKNYVVGIKNELEKILIREEIDAFNPDLPEYESNRYIIKC